MYPINNHHCRLSAPKNSMKILLSLALGYAKDVFLEGCIFAFLIRPLQSIHQTSSLKRLPTKPPHFPACICLRGAARGISDARSGSTPARLTARANSRFGCGNRSRQKKGSKKQIGSSPRCLEGIWGAGEMRRENEQEPN